MNATIETLESELEDAQCELEELNECGDLEDRLEASMRVADLEAKLFRERLKETGSV